MPSCGRVNSSEGSAVPNDFLRRSRDGKGLDYKIVRCWSDYIEATTMGNMGLAQKSSNVLQYRSGYSGK